MSQFLEYSFPRPVGKWGGGKKRKRKEKLERWMFIELASCVSEQTEQGLKKIIGLTLSPCETCLPLILIYMIAFNTYICYMQKHDRKQRRQVGMRFIKIIALRKMTGKKG